MPRALALIVLLVAALGCASPPILPASDVQRAFTTIDALQFGDITVQDSDFIAEFKALHARSKWEPLPSTLPLDLISIYGMVKDQPRFKLVYSAGWLMDTDEDGRIVRVGILSTADRNWMEENVRSKLPPNPHIY